MPKVTKVKLARSGHDAAHEIEAMTPEAHAKMLETGVLPPNFAAFLQALVTDAPKVAAAIVAIVTPFLAAPPASPAPLSPAKPPGA